MFHVLHITCKRERVYEALNHNASTFGTPSSNQLVSVFGPAKNESKVDFARVAQEVNREQSLDLLEQGLNVGKNRSAGMIAESRDRRYARSSAFNYNNEH